MKLSFSPYILRKNGGGVQEGVLLRTEDNGAWGVADICPRTELGDRSWRDELKRRGNLFLRAAELAVEDMRAREKKISLLHDNPVENNFLILDIEKVDLNSAVFKDRTVKIKSRKIEPLLSALNSLSQNVAIRLDFNSSLDPNSFEKFLSSLSADVLKRIEYIEDPTAFCENWKRWNEKVPLAFDFQPGQYDADYARVCIVKPSRQKLNTYLPYYTLTSAMDHPVGVAHGLRIAQTSAKSVSGFLTLDIYVSGPYHRYFETNGVYLNFSEECRKETGIGMTAELEKQEWIAL